jgi:hypothetical protein
MPYLLASRPPSNDHFTISFLPPHLSTVIRRLLLGVRDATHLVHASSHCSIISVASIRHTYDRRFHHSRSSVTSSLAIDRLIAPTRSTPASRPLDREPLLGQGESSNRPSPQQARVASNQAPSRWMVNNALTLPNWLHETSSKPKAGSGRRP